MNIALFGYILAWIGILVSGGMTIFTFLYYRSLSTIQKRMVTEINLAKEFIIFVVSLVYIITYHIG